MTNYQEVPKNLDNLKKMFRNIQTKETNRVKKLIPFENANFNVSFFDGVKRISCRMSWRDLSNAVEFYDNKLKFERKPFVQQQYDAFLKQLKDKNLSIYDHILKNEIKFDGVTSVGVKGQFTICRNKYPYDFGNHSHFLLWIHPECDESIRDELFNENKCKKKIGEIAKEYPSILGDKFIIFRNAKANKSVLTIEHFHIVFF